LQLVGVWTLDIGYWTLDVGHEKKQTNVLANIFQFWFFEISPK
jgi:hypothetical protein